MQQNSTQIRQFDIISGKSLFYYTASYLYLIHVVILFNVISPIRITTALIDIFGLFAAFYSLVYLGVRCCNPLLRFSLLDASVGFFVLYSICSVYLYFLPSNPASVDAYFYGIHLLILPSFIYFTVNSLNKFYQHKLLKTITTLHMVMAVLGLILFVWRPEFYTENLRKQFSQSGIEDLFALYSRLNSYMGSTATGILSAVTIAIISMCNYKVYYKYLMIVVLVTTVLLTQQRGAYISAAMATAFFLSSRKNFNLRYAVLLVGIFVIAIVYMKSSSNQVVSLVPEVVLNRVTKDIIQGDFRSERSESFFKGLNVSLEFPLGMGVGATTSAAGDAGANPVGQIVDSNYMRMICDLGYTGFYLFVAVIATSIFSVFHNEKSKFYLLLISIYCFQANFTNVFDTYYVNHIFWLILGLINAKSEI